MKKFLKIPEYFFFNIFDLYILKDYENKKIYMFDVSKMCAVILEKSANDILSNQIIDNYYYRQKLDLLEKLENNLTTKNKTEKRIKI